MNSKDEDQDDVLTKNECRTMKNGLNDRKGTVQYSKDQIFEL